MGIMFLNYRALHSLSAEKRDLAEALASTAAIAIRNRRIIAAAACRAEALHDG
jgi:GAF domain-containing protein